VNTEAIDLVGNKNVVIDDELIYTDQDENSEINFTRSERGIDSFEPSCADDSVTGSVNVEVAFLDLPDQIIVNGDVEQTEFFLWVEFDVNSNGVMDAGDVSFELVSKRDPVGEETLTNISDLVAEMQAITKHEGSRTWGTTVSSIPFTVNNDSISFSVPKSLFITLQSISPATPIAVTSRYVYGELGPEFDYFPDVEDFSDGLDNRFLQDVIGDVNGGNVGVDIVTVRVSVTN